MSEQQLTNEQAKKVIHQFVDRVLKHDFEYDYGGHYEGCEDKLLKNFQQEVVYQYCFVLSLEQESNDFHWCKVLDKDNTPTIFLSHVDIDYCPYCGNRIAVNYDGIGKITFFNKSSTPTGDSCCIARKNNIGPNKPLVTRLRFPTGKLLFVNHFGETVNDAPTELEWTDEWSLNNNYGQNNITQYLAKQGYGFGQMGNMDIAVWVSHDKKRLTITPTLLDEYIEEYINDVGGLTNEELEDVKRYKQECDKLRNDSTQLGEISLCVWRWMCSDKSNISSEFKLGKHDDAVDVDVIAGDWELKHYYLTHTTKFLFIASELTLIE